MLALVARPGVPHSARVVMWCTTTHRGIPLAWFFRRPSAPGTLSPSPPPYRRATGAVTGLTGRYNDRDNEITGVHVSDGDPTSADLLGAKPPHPATDSGRTFWTQGIATIARQCDPQSGAGLGSAPRRITRCDGDRVWIAALSNTLLWVGALPGASGVSGPPGRVTCSFSSSKVVSWESSMCRPEAARSGTANHFVGEGGAARDRHPHVVCAWPGTAPRRLARHRAWFTERSDVPWRVI